MWQVEYRGFLQLVQRDFRTREDAEAWLRKVGKLGDPVVRVYERDPEPEPLDYDWRNQD